MADTRSDKEKIIELRAERAILTGCLKNCRLGPQNDATRCVVNALKVGIQMTVDAEVEIIKRYRPGDPGWDEVAEATTS